MLNSHGIAVDQVSNEKSLHLDDIKSGFFLLSTFVVGDCNQKKK